MRPRNPRMLQIPLEIHTTRLRSLQDINPSPLGDSGTSEDRVTGEVGGGIGDVAGDSY